MALLASAREAERRAILWATQRKRGQNIAISKTLRAAFYHAAFPKYPQLHIDVSKKGTWLDGVWMMGQNYRGSGFYGSYPPGYLLRAFALFPEASKILHLFSGSLLPDALRTTHLRAMHMVFGKHSPWTVDNYPSQVRFDGNPDLKPDVLGSPHNLFSALEEFFRIAVLFDIAYVDPPYSKPDAAKYGLPYPDSKVVMRQLSQVIRPGGFVVWMDTKLPMYRKDQWEHYGNLPIIRSTNHRVRLVSIFMRLQ